MRSQLFDPLIAIAIFLSLCCSTLAKNESAKAIFDSVSPFGPCLGQATFSFLYPNSYPPKNEAELKTVCKSQAAGVKCLKETTKGSLPIVRRGALAYANTRKKHLQKICTNTASPESRRFIEMSKCLMEKRFAVYRAIDAELAQTLIAIARKNYDDSAPELKQICCAFHFFKINFTNSAGPECSKYQADVVDFGEEIATKDLEILCDDDEKLSKSCAKLERIQFKREPNYKTEGRVHVTTVFIYLVATLGEPNTDPNFNI